MDLSYFFIGSCIIWIKSSDYRRFFNICTFHGISFEEIKIDESEDEEQTVYRFKVRYDYLTDIEDAARKTNSDYKILKIQGLPFFFYMVKKHICFFVGAVMALFLLISLSGRIWDIDFVGNSYYGNEMFERFLKEQNITCGMKISSIDCMKISEQFRENFSRITWASTEIDGCRLVIHIKENEIWEQDTVDEIVADAYDLVSDRDGIIYSVMVRNGISQVEKGQSVNKGDILISGQIPIMNDAGEVVLFEEAISDGDIYLQYDYFYYQQIERKWYENVIVEERTIPVLQIEDFRFDLFELFDFQRKKKEKLYIDNILQEGYISLTKSFHLPIITGVHKQIIYEKKERNYTNLELEAMANTYFHEFCTNLEKKGVQIYENNVKINITDALCIISGKVTVIEKTGILQKTAGSDLYGYNMEE